jgi:peptidyl-tRNA hydrolase, PTH1 family
MKIIVGLGNPGKEYDNTRHNYGFMLIDKMADKAGAQWKESKKFKALVAEAADKVFVKPQTFMNNSGQSVGSLLSYYKLLPKSMGLFKSKDADLSDTLTVLHDDLDIEVGKWKESVDSRSAGHRGVQSIIEHLKTKNFKRVRLGISGEMKKVMPTDRFVLGKFGAEEKALIEKAMEEISLK